MVLIARSPVVSSNIGSVGYDADRKILAVGFQSGAVFHYSRVEPELYDQFQAAESKGAFFARHIKGKFPGEKMTGPCPKCGDSGVIGETCQDCGCAAYVRADSRLTPPADLVERER